MPDARASFRLLQDFAGRKAPAEQLDDLRRQLKAIPDFAQVDLEPSGTSTVVATVPARNQMQTDRLKALLDEKVSGWRVIEDQDYQLPTTF